MELAKDVNTAIVIAATTIPVISAFVFLTSPNSIWGLVNQYQLFLILPFLDLYLPGNFIDFLMELQISIFNFEVLDFIPLPYVGEFIRKLEYEHPYHEYQNNGIGSGSFITNEVDFIKSILVVICIHVLFTILYITMRPYKEKKLFIMTLKRFYDLFNIAVYLRIFLECFVFNILSSGNELYRVENMLVNKVSFAVSFAYFLISIVIIMLLVTVYVKSKESSKFKYFAEIYDGFKSSHLSKFYHIIFLLRRLLITAIVILMRDTKIYTKLGIYLCLQIISFLYIAVMRPSESVQQNMIDF